MRLKRKGSRENRLSLSCLNFYYQLYCQPYHQCYIMYQKLTFRKLFGYYGSKGIVLREETFEDNLGLRTGDGEYNLMAQLLSDNSHMPLRVSIFTVLTKGSNLYSVREFGNDCP